MASKRRTPIQFPPKNLEAILTGTLSERLTQFGFVIIKKQILGATAHMMEWEILTWWTFEQKILLLAQQTHQPNGNTGMVLKGVLWITLMAVGLESPMMNPLKKYEQWKLWKLKNDLKHF